MALLLITAPATGQNSRSRMPDPEANAGAKLTAYLKSAGMPATNPAGARQLFIDKYCADCHNSIDVAGSLDLSLYETEKLGRESEVGEKVSRKLRVGMLPPSNAKARPPVPQANIFAASVEQTLEQDDI